LPGPISTLPSSTSTTITCSSRCSILIGFRNRFIVATSWLWNYVTFQRGTRLITGVSGARMEDMPVREEEKPPLRGAAQAAGHASHARRLASQRDLTQTRVAGVTRPEAFVR